MKAILLAGGYGTRLRPLTLDVPKCLVPIKGRPLLDYWIELLVGNGFDVIIVNTHWLPDQVRDYVKASKWRDRISLVHEPVLLGTGGTIRSNTCISDNEDVFVAHADNLVRFDLSAFTLRHRQRPPYCVMSLLSFRTDSPQTCGILELNSDAAVINFHEKVANPPGNIANGAVYILTPAIIDYIHQFNSGILDFSLDVIPNFIGRILAVETDGYHRDIGSLESLAQAELEF